MAIPASLRQDLCDIPVLEDPGSLRMRSRDFFWFSPILKETLDDKRADIVVVPMEARTDRSSGQGTMLAAMALGKPLVVNDVPGVRDYVTDGETGLIVPRRDPEALASALKRLLTDAGQRARLGEAAERDVRRRFLREHYVERVLALVDRIAPG